MLMTYSTMPPRTTLIQSKLLRIVLPFGLAITLPIPKRRQLILSRRVMTEAEQRHEYCHAWQIVDWGWFSFLGRHIWARVKSRSWTAPLSDVEFPAYQVQHPEMSNAELEVFLVGE